MPIAHSDPRQTGLVEAIREVRKRLVANRWLGLWVVCCNCTIAALLVAVAVMRSITGPLIAALAAVIMAAVGTAIAAWYTKPSTYKIAQRLDQESRSGDRISTAVYFWTVANPDELLRRQRADALAHVAKVQPRQLFPLQAPPKLWRTGALLGGLAAFCAFHAVYGPAIPRLAEKAARSRTLSTLFSPMTHAIEFARAEKKELADLVAGNEHDRQASETSKTSELPPPNQPTGSAQTTANAAKMDMSQAQQMASAGTPSEGQAPSGATPNQQTGTPANAQNASATNQQATQTATGQGQQSLGQKALQALENLMSSALSGQQNGGQSPSTASQPPNAGTTSTQAMAGASQIASMPNQSAQGQTSNSQGSQNQTTPNPGKHTGAGNGTSPWQPRDAMDPQLAGNVAKQHVALQTTGYRGPPGKERSDVAPGTAQIPLQDLSPQRVTTVNGAGQDSIPPRYRQYVQNYFQHSGK